MRRLSQDSGFTLIEVLLVSVLFLVVLGATLTTATSFMRGNKVAETRFDQVELARNSLDRAARQLRNLAQRVDQPTIHRAGGNDFIFQTSDPTRTWVRYCLQTTAPASPTSGRLWEMSSASSTPSGDTGSCPGSGWSSTQIVAQHITNASIALPVFRYTCVGEATPCPPSATNSAGVTGVAATLQVDEDHLRRPPAVQVTSAVYLRNQNEPPTATWTWTPAGTRRVILNASASSDPESRTLRYFWFAAATAPAFSCKTGPPAGTQSWIGITLTHTFDPTVATNSIQSFTLVVCDPGDLQSRFTSTVRVPT